MNDERPNDDIRMTELPPATLPSLRKDSSDLAPSDFVGYLGVWVFRHSKTPGTGSLPHHLEPLGYRVGLAGK